MSIRSAPIGGYDFGQKRQYRRRVWRALSDGLHGKPTAQILLMPSSEGDEIEVAIGKGFKEQNIHIVDRNPAIVATLKRRFPLATTYGVELHRALRRIHQNGITLTAANFDGCSPLHMNLVKTCHAAASNMLFEDRARVAITMLRGRESGFARDLICHSAVTTFRISAESAAADSAKYLPKGSAAQAHLTELFAKDDTKPCPCATEYAALSQRDRARIAAISFALTGLGLEHIRPLTDRERSARIAIGEDPERVCYSKFICSYWPMMKTVFSYKSTAGTQTLLVIVWEMTLMARLHKERPALAESMLSHFGPYAMAGLLSSNNKSRWESEKWS